MTDARAMALVRHFKIHLTFHSPSWLAESWYTKRRGYTRMSQAAARHRDVKKAIGRCVEIVQRDDMNSLP
jgi:hypothetical protein